MRTSVDTRAIRVVLAECGCEVGSTPTGEVVGVPDDCRFTMWVKPTFEGHWETTIVYGSEFGRQDFVQQLRTAGDVRDWICATMRTLAPRPIWTIPADAERSGVAFPWPIAAAALVVLVASYVVSLAG